MVQRWSRWRLAAAAFCIGVLMAAGQAPFGIWGATLLALSLLFALILAQATSRRAAWAAWFGGAGYFCAALSWIISPFLIDADTYAWMAPFALVLMGFGLAVFWALAAILARRFARAALALPVLLAGAELARGYVATGFPWAALGHVWIDTPLAMGAAYGGAAGLTLVTTLLAGAAASGGTWLRLLAILGFGAAWGAGELALRAPMPDDAAITARLIQPNAAQSMKWDEGQAQLFFDRLMARTGAAPAPDLVIWPETALPYALEYQPGLAQMIAQRAGGATVILGRQRVNGSQGWNSLSVLDPSGTEQAIYDKHHLVPFGEYIPLGDLAFRWFGITAFAAQVGYGYTAGAGPTVIDLGAWGKMLPLICYEAVFPQDLRGTVRPDWLLHITNDAWFGTLTGPFQHAAQARFRAIEQGLPLLRAANTGVTAVYDARGRLRASLPFGIEGHLDTALPAPLPQTLYARFGDWPLAVLLGGLALLAIRKGRRRGY